MNTIRRDLLCAEDRLQKVGQTTIVLCVRYLDHTALGNQTFPAIGTQAFAEIAGERSFKDESFERSSGSLTNTTTMQIAASRSLQRRHW